MILLQTELLLSGSPKFHSTEIVAASPGPGQSITLSRFRLSSQKWDMQTTTTDISGDLTFPEMAANKNFAAICVKKNMNSSVYLLNKTGNTIFQRPLPDGCFSVSFIDKSDSLAIQSMKANRRGKAEFQTSIYNPKTKGIRLLGGWLVESYRDHAYLAGANNRIIDYDLKNRKETVRTDLTPRLAKLFAIRKALSGFNGLWDKNSVYRERHWGSELQSQCIGSPNLKNIFFK